MVTTVSAAYLRNVGGVSRLSLIWTIMGADEQVDLGQRRWQRLYTNLVVWILVRKPECVRIVAGRGTQLNDGGMAVDAGIELEVGDRVDIELPMSDSQPPLRYEAVVRNRVGYR